MHLDNNFSDNAIVTTPGARIVHDSFSLVYEEAEVLVSPVLAGLAVGIGVPILLFYVYGVVPVSLCRSGGCGVTTNGSGVRFDFDDETELMGALGGRNVGDAASIDVASHRGGNPSIGEASLSLGSGSQLEKLGRENDRESASNVALAGTSIAGSIASSVMPSGQRLEVQADVISTQRFSLCSETASAATSLSEKSVNASIAADDGAASTRALAGSVLNFKVDGGSIGGGRSGESEVINLSSTGQIDSAGQAASLSSLEEIAPGLAKRARRRPTLDRQQSDSSSWTIHGGGGEDNGSERVRFDDHVSFIEADQELTGIGNGRGARRKRNKDCEQDVEAQKSTRSANEDGDVGGNLTEDVPREKINVAALRNVFFHSGNTCNEKRLPIIEEPSPISSATAIHILIPQEANDDTPPHHGVVIDQAEEATEVKIQC
ncbi:hypothetical protein PV325_013130 [Microctonus aethiopoides]|nr:hypothetical protein PV325_013130 [Microctonus aethiopoides]KAK0093396.1 hypothetical protein PV326_013600 [Microctonus aethiopoides]